VSLLPQDVMVARGIPLPSALAVPVHERLEWEDIQARHLAACA